MKSVIELKIDELEQFLKELDEARKFSENKGGLQISPIAGILEQRELKSLKFIMEHTE